MAAGGGISALGVTIVVVIVVVGGSDESGLAGDGVLRVKLVLLFAFSESVNGGFDAIKLLLGLSKKLAAPVIDVALG